MERGIRRYCVGDLVFGLELSAPYSFMEYSEPVMERIRSAAAGILAPVLPTRAGDEVPTRTFVRSRDELTPEPHPFLSIFPSTSLSVPETKPGKNSSVCGLLQIFPFRTLPKRLSYSMSQTLSLPTGSAREGRRQYSGF